MEEVCSSLTAEVMLEIFDTTTINDSDLDLSLSSSFGVFNDLTNSSKHTPSKKRRIEPEWSWKTIAQEFRTTQDDSKRLALSLIIENLIDTHWTLTPIAVLKSATEFIQKKILDVDLTDFKHRSKSNKFDLLNLFKKVYFDLFHKILNNLKSANCLSELKINQECIDKTTLFYLDNLNVQSLQKLVNLTSKNNSFIKIDSKLINKIIDKFINIVTSVSSNDVEPEFFTLITNVIENERMLNEERKVEIAESLLPPVQSLLDTENDDLDESMPYATQTQSAKAKNITKSKNKDIYLKISGIILSLLGLNSEKALKAENLLEILTPVLNFDLNLEHFYDQVLKPNDKEITSKAEVIQEFNFDIKMGILMVKKLIDRGKCLKELTDPENTELLGEYLVNLDFFSSILKYSNEHKFAISYFETNIDLINDHLKSLFNPVQTRVKSLFENFNIDSIKELNSILDQLLLLKFDSLFYVSIDLKFCDIWLQLISRKNEETKELEESHELQTLKSNSLRFLLQFSFGLIISSDKLLQNLNPFGKNLKKKIIQYIYSFYFEQSNKLCLSASIQSSSMYHFCILMVFLNGCKNGKCRMLSWNEFEFCLSVFETILRNKYFEFDHDPKMSEILLKSLNEYSSKLLITKAFAEHPIQVESNADQIDNLIDKFINLVDIMYSIYETGSFSSNNCLCQVLDLIVQGIKLIRLRLIGFEEKLNDEVKRLRKDFIRKLNENFTRALTLILSRSNFFKFKVVNVFIEGVFDCQLYRRHLFECLTPIDYLDSLPQLKNKLNSNDEFENYFFDKTLSTLMENYSIFNNDTPWTELPMTKSIEERYSYAKKQVHSLFDTFFRSQKVDLFQLFL